MDDTLLEAVDVTAGLKETGAIIINTTKDNDYLKKALHNYSGNIYKIDARKVSMETLRKIFSKHTNARCCCKSQSNYV